MGIATYTWKASDYPPLRFADWEGEHWLGYEVEFTLQGNKTRGIVEGVERHRLANGVHDILTVEVWDGDCQMKIQAHRQKFRRITS